VPDLIGVRAIYLFNEQWVFVDNFIRINLPIKRSPKPIAYIQKPIPDRLRSAFTAAGLSVKIGKHGYQSVHYEMRKRVGVRSFRVEVQARTLYQEAWGEVSHVTAYPYRQDVALLVESMRQLAEITSKADHFSSAIEAIVQLWDARKARRMPDPAFVDDFIERLKFLKKHHPDIAADLIDASSEFSVSKLDSSFGLPTR
jgi:ppGpp synthetase/RelA/SpoT-type nucleotidyltranferase